ncbi:MAG TPA: Ig-like domain-containing protein [Gemmatimonadales bacterium]|nr:Ig-like domain-containing protein [Gemmatimonadales bacterium]
MLRGLLPVVLAAGAVVTCDSPTAPARRMVGLAFQPVVRYSMATFSGMAVDQVRLIAVHGSDSVSQVFNFSPDSSQIKASMAVPVTDTATYLVTIQLLSGGTVMFTGQQAVLVSAGLSSPPTQVVELAFVGPGSQIAFIQIAPRDTGVSFGSSLPFRLTAMDSSEGTVTQFYVAWSTSAASNKINANGVFKAGTTRGTVWVYAHTPTGVQDSTQVTVSPVPSRIVIVSGNGQSGPVGTALELPLVVQVLAADNLPVPGTTVRFAASGGGSVRDSVVVADSLGLAQTVATLSATAGTNAFTAKVGSLAQVQFTATGIGQVGAPASITKVAGDGQSAAAGTPVVVPPSVKVTDANSNPVPGQAVTFAVASGGGTVTGGSTTTNAAGIATVGSWTLGSTPGPNTLTATATGTSLSPVTFTATGTTASNAIVLSVPGGLVGIGASQQAQAVVTIAPPAPTGGLTVTVTSDSTKYVTVKSPGTISIPAGGVVGTILLAGVAPGQTTLHATAPGYTAGTTIAVATPNYIALTYDSVGLGRTAVLGMTLSTPAPAGGLLVGLVSGDTTKFKFIKGAVSNPAVGSLVDTIPAGSTSGSVTITGLGTGTVPVYAVAPNYAIGLEVVVVTGFNGSLALVSGGGQTGGVDTLLAQPVTVKVTDSLSNPVSGFLVGFAVASGGGSVSPAAATTNSSGQASTSWTLGSTVGAQSLSVTAPGASGSPLTVTATATGAAIASTTVSPKLDTITAINGTVTLVAQAKTAAGGSVPGSYTWSSRNTAIAAVSPLGVVIGLANGSTWVIATEAGGTKDSAQIIVQQKLASITVTPANRNLYLGTSFNYTAQAVDGLGTALPSNPPFTWSTTAAAVATVDTAGHVSAVGLGSAQIKATSGTITGVGNLTVLTAITRIAVAVDSGGATKNDTASLPSLAVTRRYHGYAYDTLNVLMPAVTQFTWASTNPSVASVPNQTSDTATATSAANGVTFVRATAQGFTSAPGALLTVSQVLASIQLSAPASNPTATIGIGGTVSLDARGLDANSRYISGGTYKYVSQSPAIATVDSVSGQVTGIANGTDTVTASSGAITSNKLVVTVGGGSVPKVISFGRDTVSVGRGSTASIPVLLSTPLATGGQFTVNLGVSPAAYAHWQTTTVTVAAGATSVNATLVGDSAGTTTVTASDGSGGGYTAGSAVAKVTANMILTCSTCSFAGGPSSYAINATDVVTTQVKLSDPSPAGGTYITFTYGTPGIASVSPDPAYIPAGQLAADIQIRGLAGGTTTITPVAVGVNGAASTFTAYAPVLTLTSSTSILGLGQYDPNHYVYAPTNTNVPIPVTLTSTDTTKTSVTPAITIPAGYSYAYLTLTGTGLGTAKISAAATGWTTSDTILAITSTPHVGICCSNTIYTTSGTQYLYVYSEDSTKSAHYRVNSLLVNVRSSDTTVMKVLDTLVTIQPSTYYTYGARLTPGALGGTAYIVVTASGHTPDSALYTVNGPPLNLSWSTRLLGAGQQDLNSVYVYTPNNVTAPLTVTLSNSDATKIGVPDSVVIPTGYNYAYFTVQGLAAGGPVTIGATAPGFGSASATYTVTTPTIISPSNYTFNNFNPGTNLYVYSADTTRNTHWRIASEAVAVSVVDTSKIKVDSSSVTIPAGAYYSNAPHITPAAVGSTRILLSAPGQLSLDSPTVTVNTPPIQFNFGQTLLGRRQHLSSSNQGFYVYTPDSRSVAVPATLSQKHASVDSISNLLDTIPASSNYVYAEIFGLANGTDTLSVAATGYASPSNAYVVVSTPKFTTGGMPSSTTTTNPPIALAVYASDSLGSSHWTMDTVVVHAVSSDTTVLKVTSANVRIPKNSYYVEDSVIVVGPGTASVTFSDSAGTGYQPVTTNTITVTGPSLYLNYSSLVLGNRQTTGPTSIYVYTTNSVATPLTVHLLSTGTTVATVPDSVVILANTNYAYFTVTGQDTIGTVQIQASATGYTAATASVEVTRPKFVISATTQLNTTSPRTALYVYAEDANGTTHYTAENVVVTLASSATAVATIDSATVTIPAGGYYSNAATWGPGGTTGTAQLSATDTRAAQYAYNQGTLNVGVVTPSLNFDWTTMSLGIGQYNDMYVYTPDAATSPINVNLSHTGTPRTSIILNDTARTAVTIPTGTNYVYFHVVGASVGTDTLVGTTTSPVENPATAYTGVSLGQVSPIGGWPATLSLANGDSALITMYAYDSAEVSHYVQNATTFTLAPSGSIEFVSGGASSAVITSVLIPKDSYYVQFYVKGVSQGTGQATITASGYATYNTPTITVSP